NLTHESFRHDFADVLARREGFMPLLLRSAWSIARFGETLLPLFEEWFVNRWWKGGCDFPAMVLATVALKHPHLTARVRKALAAPSGPRYAETDAPDASETYRRAVADAALHVIDRPQGFRLLHGTCGACLLTQGSVQECLPEGNSWRFSRAEDVPDAIGETFAANGRYDPARTQDHVLRLLMCAPWLAQAELEDLFLPAEVERTINPDWSPASTQLVLASEIERTQPVPTEILRADPKTPRNAPCPCASGRKYKACCGK
ncbi:MAG: SEC-C metal-binding domain-containing protein, partial [Polyangiaceae bacterium]